MHTLRSWIVGIAATAAAAGLLALLATWLLPKYFDAAQYWSVVGVLTLLALGWFAVSRVIEAIVNPIRSLALRSWAYLVITCAIIAVFNSLLATWFMPKYFDAALYWSIMGIIALVALLGTVVCMILVVALDRRRWRRAQLRSSAEPQHHDH